ncbi:hypothetical protein AOLI_G00082310 [Acnodon oligacanthus]
MEEHSRGLAELLLEGELGAVTLGLEQGLFSWDELDLPHNSHGSTPLISACQMGLTTVMRFLLERGADATLCNHDNQTALHVSPPDLQGGLLAALESRLCHQGQLSEAAWRGDMSTLQHLLTLTDLMDVNSQNRNGLTPLMLAVRDVDLFEGLQDIIPWDYRPVEIVKALLALSASLEVQDEKGYIALHYISQIRSPIKDELLQIILKSKSDCSGNSHGCSPPTLAAVKRAAHEDSNQDKIISLFFQTAMEPKRNSRRGSTQLSKATGRTSSLPNLRDRNKCWDKLDILHCTSDVPVKISLIPIPPKPTEKSKSILESPLVPQLSPLSQSAPSLAVLDASVLLQVRANIYNRLSKGETDTDVNGHKGPLPVLCPRTPKHLAPLDRASQDGPVLSSLQRPVLLKPISILPANSVSRQQRERFSRLNLRASRGTRRGSAESTSSSCSSESSLDEGEEEENSSQEIQKMFSTLKKDSLGTLVSLSSSEHFVNSEPTDIAQHVLSNNEDMLITSQFKKNQEVEVELSHISVNECEQDGERCSADLLKKDKVVEIVGSLTDLDGPKSMGTEVRLTVDNGKSSTLADVEHQHLSPENITVSQPATVEKHQPMKATKSKERKCRPFHTSQSFNILAYRNTNWGTVNTKRNRRNSSISSQVKSKDMNPTDYMKGETTNKLDWPRTAPSTSQKVKDAPLTRRRAQDFPHPVKLSGDKKILNKYQSRELQTARQPKKPESLGMQRAKSALDSVSYSDMFLQIHQGDKGPAIFEMFATPIYENLRVGSSAERTKQVQPALQVKRSLNGQWAKKNSEGNRRKQQQKCSHSKGKTRKRRNIQQIRPQNISQSVEMSKDEAIVIAGLDENFHIRHPTILPNKEDKRNTNEGSPMLSVIKEVHSNCTTGTPINHEKDLHTLSPSALPLCLSRQLAQLTSEAHKENCSSEIKDSVVEEFPVQPMINTWTSTRTRSPVYQKFLDEVGEGPVTDDLLRCLAEELISLEEREVETLKSEHTEKREIITSQPKLKEPTKQVTLSSDKLPQTFSVDDTITWTKGEVLGKGAYGTVCCGLTSQGQLIAVKQVVLDISTSETAEKEYNRLEREVDLLKNLHHPNIVGFLGTSLTDNIISIFMEYIPGGSISSVLNRFGPLPEKVFALYTRQILEGVAYLHDNRVIHRDLKGNNIMLMPTGIVKLIDFGCARRLNHLSISGGHSDLLRSVHGTPYWMAPEVINETGHGRKSDIWSIGCTVFEMATGKPPLAHMGKIAALFYIGARKGLMPSLPEDFSEEAKSFVKACLISNQKQRPSAAELLRHPFISHHRQPKSNKPCSNPHHLPHQTN